MDVWLHVDLIVVIPFVADRTALVPIGDVFFSSCLVLPQNGLELACSSS